MYLCIPLLKIAIVSTEPAVAMHVQRRKENKMISFFIDKLSYEYYKVDKVKKSREDDKVVNIYLQSQII